MKRTSFFVILLLMFLTAGCTNKGGNIGQLQSYVFSQSEADWIRNGEPIEFETELWYPMDGVETLIDSEVQMVGEYRGVQVFVDKVDVRPYRRLYTKFGRNQFRFFEKLPLK